MHAGLDLLLLMIAVVGAWLAAGFTALAYFRSKQTTQVLTAQGAAQLLRSETDIVRAAIEDQAGRLRLELSQSLKGFQRLIELLAQATSLVFDGAAHDFGLRSQKLGDSLGGQQLWRLF